jgi:hypothetical protein
MNCKKCNQPMKQLFTSEYCDCTDKALLDGSWGEELRGTTYKPVYISQDTIRELQDLLDL